MSNRPERQTPSDRLAEDEAQGYVPGVRPRERSTPTVRPGCPAGEAINSNPPDGCSTAGGISSDHQAGCPAEEGLITPTAGRVQGEKGFTLQPSGLGRGRRAKSLQPSARAACGGLCHSALAASLVGDLFGASRAEGTTPRFLGRETLEKPDNASIISASATARQGLGSPLAEINHLSSQKFTGSRRNPASLIAPRDRT